MRLVMTMLARDEEDVIACNLDYHLRRGVDFVIATDHGSRDATIDILREYERAGVLKLLRAGGDEHHQSRRVTEMARLAADAHGADWVINNDADEFWWPQLGTLKDVLAAIPDRYGQLEVERRNFLPRPDAHGPFYRRLDVREVASRNLSDQPLESKVTHRAAADVVVAPGNHGVRGSLPAAAPAFGAVEIFHYPMRSYEQFERKVRNTGIGYESLSDRSPGVGRDQLKLLDLERAGLLPGFFVAQLLDGEQIERGIERGELVVDRRLARFLDDDRPVAAAPGRSPERLALESLGAQVFGQAERAEQAERDLDAAGRRHRAELAQAAEAARQAAARVGALESDLGAAHAAHAALRDALGRTEHSYRLLLESRLVRSSRRARLLWYRLRGG